MSAPAAKRMSSAEFLAFAQTRERGRFELVGGEIVAMSPERAEHVKAKAVIWRALAAAIDRSGAPCEAFVDGLAVVIDDETAYEPDALVNFGEKIAPDSLVAPAPVVVVEVISPSSRNLDKSIKLAGYFRIASLAHYLVVDLAARLVYHYKRNDEGPMTVMIVRDGLLELDPPGLRIALTDIFV
jgi:Uma2 family endonuclease